MFPIIRLPSILVALLLLVPSSVLGQKSGTDTEAKPTLGKIFEEDIMFTNKAFSASVRFAGLVDTLKDEGPFTVFVFTNKAANPLQKEFPNPDSSPAFRSMIQYHVVPDRKLMASDFMDVDELQTLEGTPIEVETKGGTTVVAEGGEEGQRVSKQPKTIVLKGRNEVTIGPDPTHRNLTTSSNGVIHIIESVLRVPDQ